MLGHLIERARAVHLPGAERADDQRRIQAARDRVCVRIAEVHADGRPAVLTDSQVRLYQALRHTIERLRRTAIAARRDEGGAIPAEVAWIAGLVVLAIAVIAIITLITTTKASSISLN